ncbi:MAG: hypothetical protein J6K94_02035 [Ruminiclostridium sp.]|nr:hypothetical protein [Ruminiclostridium sp.]
MDFWKMNGAPKDFIILNNCQENLPETTFPLLAKTLCDPVTSLGADGLLVADKGQGRVSAALYDREGSRKALDESAARCICRFARELGLSGQQLQVETPEGPILGQQVDRRSYRVRLGSEDPWSQGTTNLVARGEILDEDLPELYWLLGGSLCL